MSMKEFYEKYHLNKYNFAEMAHVGTRSLIKYEQGKDLREGTKAKIEKAMRVIEKHNYVRPRHKPGNFDAWYNTRFTREVQDYMRRFEELLRMEEGS